MTYTHPISRRDTNRLEAFPTGWFVVCFSDELKPGQILNLKFMGQDLIVFRTEKGEACVTDAFCPHMGAHFGFGGTVEGETIRCPFHSFCFDTSGACVKTGYGTPPPKKARLRTWPVNEMNGLILVYHQQFGEPPVWHIPTLDDEMWTPLVHHEWEIRANPYDTAENSVDLGHLSIVHGYRNVNMLKPLSTDGPFLTARYEMNRDAGVFGKRNDLRAEFEIHKWGLGYSAVEVAVPEYGLRSRHFVFPTAMDEDTMKLRVAISVRHVEKPEKINPLLRFFPRWLLHKIILGASMKGYRNDVEQDFEIWRNKIAIPNPPLAEGDGPIWQYRQWTKQFDPRHDRASGELPSGEREHAAE